MMKKKFKFGMVLGLILVASFGGLTNISRADDTPPAHLNLTASVDVPASCTATDTDGANHEYPIGDSYLAICALEAALSSGQVSGVGLSNQYPSLGLFVTSINNVTADPSSQYWALYQNGNFAQLGITSMPVAVGDVIKLQIEDFSSNPTGDQLVITINSLVPSTPAGGAGAPAGSTNTSQTAIAPTKPVFDLAKAFDFLSKQQKEDGSFGEDLYTDWVALALPGNTNQSPTIKLIKYLNSSKISGTNLTDYERHAMALMALGLNPYNTAGVDYIKKITDSFDGEQFGDVHEDNDDIFALIVLKNGGYALDDKMLADDAAFVVKTQSEDGSWNGSVDMTGAAIEALNPFADHNHDIKLAIKKAKDYLKKNQKDDGGFGNVSSSAWAAEGIIAMYEKPEDWPARNADSIATAGGKTPLDYLATMQDTDGGIKGLPANTEGADINNRIWQTAYAVNAFAGKTWNEIMQKFDKPAEPIPTPKPIIAKINQIKPKTEDFVPKIEDAPQINNAANAINALDSSSPASTENWFISLLKSIF